MQWRRRIGFLIRALDKLCHSLTPFVLSAPKPQAEVRIEGLLRFDTALRLRLSTYSAQTVWGGLETMNVMRLPDFCISLNRPSRRK